jgi:hypothetical protein
MAAFPSPGDLLPLLRQALWAIARFLHNAFTRIFFLGSPSVKKVTKYATQAAKVPTDLDLELRVQPASPSSIDNTAENKKNMASTTSTTAGTISTTAAAAAMAKENRPNGVVATPSVATAASQGISHGSIALAESLHNLKIAENAAPNVAQQQTSLLAVKPVTPISVVDDHVDDPERLIHQGFMDQALDMVRTPPVFHVSSTLVPSTSPILPSPS